jgi:hypothetical protein
VSELDDVFARIMANCARIEAMIQELVDRLDRLPQDVPLHQRGFGVMDESPP